MGLRRKKAAAMSSPEGPPLQDSCEEIESGTGALRSGLDSEKAARVQHAVGLECVLAGDGRRSFPVMSCFTCQGSPHSPPSLAVTASSAPQWVVPAADLAVRPKASALTAALRGADSAGRATKRVQASEPTTPPIMDAPAAGAIGQPGQALPCVTAPDELVAGEVAGGQTGPAGPHGQAVPGAAASSAAAATVSRLNAATAVLAASLERVDSTGFFELLEFPTVG